MRRKLLRDFLILAAILSALAALIGPDIYTSMQRSKQRHSAINLRDWGTALEEYFAKHGTFPRAGYSGPVAGIAPLIPKRLSLPVVDDWGYPILYHSSGQHYALRSTGRDGRNDHLIAQADTRSYDDDILIVDGGYTRTPPICGGPNGDDWDVKKFGECASCHPHRIRHS